MNSYFDETEIRKTVSAIKPNGELFEIRYISGKWNASGYFTNADTLLAEIKKFRPKSGACVYFTLNHISQECYSRAQRDRLIEFATPTTGDREIEALEWIMVDLDPIRASGTSSSNEQIEYAKITARKIFKFLKARGWSNPVVALSGNGIHLLYKIELKNDPERVELVKKVLMALNMLFADSKIDVDQKTFNPARICKLYGTIAQKGSNTEDRPHRMSKILSSDEQIKPNDITLLQSLVELLPKEEKPQNYNKFNPKSFDLQEWIDSHGIAYTEKSSWNGGTKWVLEQCPFDENHKGKDASIIQTADGKICYNCFHASCSGNHWKEFRKLYEPDAYEKKEYTAPNHTIADYVPRPVIQSNTENEPIFYTTEQIRLKKTPPEEFIKTGVNIIDVKMRGLKKGFVSCISGLRASGKSSIISQLTLEAAQQGYRVALFSGELTCKNLLNWLVLQASGKSFVVPTQYENYYRPVDGIEEIISKWLDDKVFVYNNDYGNVFTEIMSRISECAKEHQVDLIILDNLMALDIENLDSDKYARQSMFVGILESFAKLNNVHIIFVAHPRKSQGFLRLDDVSGSNDIVNRVDNAFIVHRVNEDFKRLSNEMFKWKEDNPIYRSTNVIEICKDRDGGQQDVFIPLYFEPETKRLRNREDEYKHYDWEIGNKSEKYDILPDLPF